MLELLNIFYRTGLASMTSMRLFPVFILIIPLSIQAQVSRWVSNSCESGSGAGTYTWANGDHYRGQCQNQQIHGHGTLTMVNGDRYVGLWRQGERHGPGYLVYANGEKVEQTYANDKTVG